MSGLPDSWPEADWTFVHTALGLRLPIWPCAERRSSLGVNGFEHTRQVADLPLPYYD